MSENTLNNFINAIIGASDKTQISSVLVGNVNLTDDKESLKCGIVKGSMRLLEDEDTTDIDITISPKHRVSYCEGTFSFSESFMKGDFKPEGATGSLLALLELLDHPDVQTSIAAELS